MNCEPYIELMSAAIDGECTAEERRALDSHLAVCPECAELYAQLCRNAQAARELDCEVPADLKARIMNNLPAQEPAKQGKVIRWKRWVPVAAAACLVLVVSLLPGSVRSNNDAAFMAAESSLSNKTAPDAAANNYSMNGSAATGNAEVCDSAEAPADVECESSTAPIDSVAPADPASPAGSLPPVDPASPTDVPTAPESVADSGTYENSGSTADPDFSIQTGSAKGEDNNVSGTQSAGDSGPVLEPVTGLVPSIQPLPGGVIGGSDIYVGEFSWYAFENPQAIRVHYGATPTPGAVVIDSVDALNGYLARFGSMAWDENDNPIPNAALETLRETYTEEFFLNSRLVCAVVESGSGSNRYEIAGLAHNSVIIRMQAPEIGTADMAAWLLVAEVDAMFDGADTLEMVIIH